MKTRLSPTLSKTQRRELYRAFVEDIVSEFRSARARLTVCFTPAEAETRVRDWLGPGPDYRPQSCGDLGDRMDRAFSSAFAEGAEKVILTGSDIPGLTAADAEKALSALDDHPVVIGPSYDGGYYLIGFRREAYLPEVFHSMEWSRPSVFQRTIHTLRQNNRGPARMPPRRDMDTPEDLCRLMDELAEPDAPLHAAAPATAARLLGCGNDIRPFRHSREARR